MNNILVPILKKSSSGLIVWLTGRPASGKTTLAIGLHKRLEQKGLFSFILDGDIIRQNFCSDLGFSREDRRKNVYRVSKIAALIAKTEMVLVALISPYVEDRDLARAIAPKGRFLEVYLSTPLEVCEGRDPKGNYAKARTGIIKGFTGIDDPYEVPQTPGLILPTHKLNQEICLDRLEEAIERFLMSMS